MNKTQKKILDAAFEILAQDISAPLERVAEHAGVTRMTLHRYYAGREALVEATVLEMIRMSNQIIDDAVISARTKLREIQSTNSSISIGDMFEMQMLMNQLAQFSEMATGVVAASHQAIQSMARNVKS